MATNPGLISYFNRPSIASDQYGIAAGQDFSEGGAPVFGPGDADYESMNEKPDSSPADAISYGDSKQEGKKGGKWGEIIKSLLAIAGGYAVGKFAGGIDTTEGMAAVAKGILGEKLKQKEQQFDEQQKQEKFYVTQAMSDVRELTGADLSGLTDIPPDIKQQLATAHARAMEDKVMTQKEAQELLALANPVKAALAKKKAFEASPEGQAGRKEAGDYAGLLAQAKRVMEGKPYTVTRPLPPGQQGPPEPEETFNTPEDMARAISERTLQRQVPDEQGLLPPERATLERSRMSQEGMNQRQQQRLAQARELALLRLNRPKNAREKSLFELATKLLPTANQYAESAGEALAEALRLAEEQIGAGTTAPGPRAPSVVEWERGPDGKPRPRGR